MRLALLALVPAAIASVAGVGGVARADDKPAEVSSPSTNLAANASTLNAANASSADKNATAKDAPAERRAGVVIGLMIGFGAAGSSGYPNSASKIDDPNYYSSSDLLGGSGFSFFVMGALTDYVNFGFWFGASTYQSKDWRSTGGGGGLRVELFPLYTLVPKLRDLGIMGDFGFGGTKLTAKEGNYPPAVATESTIGVGAFYDFFLFKGLGGHFAGGPNLEYDAIFSRSAERHGALLGGRFAFYGGK